MLAYGDRIGVVRSDDDLAATREIIVGYVAHLTIRQVKGPRIMKHIRRLSTLLSMTLLLTILLSACGGGTTPAANGPAPTTQQVAGLEQTTPSPAPSTMTSIATNVQPTRTLAPPDEPEPIQTPTDSPVTPRPAVVAPTPTEQVQQSAPAVTVQAEIKGFLYQPDPLEIAAGTTVVWTNQDAAPHTVTHGTYVKRGGAFDSGTRTQGQSFAFTFAKAGNYPYTCIIHPEMIGTVKVVWP